ncbi:FAD-binding oxidoreductase, partial [Actinophytocola sp.]|uniref:FAD-binding oxidoreductase n=1 Tax=Actinophytocola sp. TaxID=1872138 RepID=UPI002D7E82AA
MLETRLAALVGPEHVLTDRDVLAGYETDWTGRYRGRARLAVRPADSGEVAGVLRACRAAGAPVVPQGGNTGLVGGGVPRDGEVVLSLARLTGLGPVDPLAGQVTVGAGATLAAVQRHVRATGLDVGVDLAARDSATIGGMVATNAGGLRVLRWGSMRAQVAGLEAVLADGRV